MKHKTLSVLSVGTAGLAAVLLGAGWWYTAVVAQTATAKESRNGTVRINNDGKTTWDDTKSQGRMLTNVRVTQDGEDFILYCEELRYNSDTNQAIARGKVRVESRDSTITGTEIRANFDTKIITVLNNVVMKSHGTEDGIKGSDPKKPAPKVPMRDEIKKKASRLTCDLIDYNYENLQATLTGNIRMVQGKNTGTCERIVFDEDKNIAQLTSADAYGVKFTDGKARTILTREVIVYIDEDNVVTKFPVKMDIPRPNGKQAAPQPGVEFPPLERISDDPFAEPAANGVPAAAGAPAAPTTPVAPAGDPAVPKDNAKPTTPAPVVGEAAKAAEANVD